MKAATLAGGPAGLRDAVRRCAAAARAKVEWIAVDAPTQAVEAIRRTRAGLILGTLAAESARELDLAAGLGLFRRLQGEAFVDLVIVHPAAQDDPARLAHAAFGFAAAHARQTVTLCHPNAAAMRDIAKDYPQIISETRAPEEVRRDLAEDPSRVDVVVWGREGLAEILGAAAAAAGGPELCPSAAVSETTGVFCGTSPVSALLAAAMLLDRLHESQAADRLARAVGRAVQEGASDVAGAVEGLLTR